MKKHMLAKRMGAIALCAVLSTGLLSCHSRCPGEGCHRVSLPRSVHRGGWVLPDLLQRGWPGSPPHPFMGAPPTCPSRALGSCG